MLVISRRQEEEIVIAGCIRIKVIGIDGKRVQLGITAPDEISIERPERIARDKVQEDRPAVQQESAPKNCPETAGVKDAPKTAEPRISPIPRSLLRRLGLGQYSLRDGYKQIIEARILDHLAIPEVEDSSESHDVPSPCGGCFSASTRRDFRLQCRYGCKRCRPVTNSKITQGHRCLER